MNMSRQNLPLYTQIREALVTQISTGVYSTGECLPSEIALADAAGVSPGTVRKAIDSLVAEGVLRRHQGKGTFVTEHTEDLARYKFLRLTDRSGSRVVPEAGRQSVTGDRVTAEIAAKLDIDARDPVWRIERTRLISGEPALCETVVVAQNLMPDLDKVTDLPNALYPFYQSRFGISVISTDDALTAVLSSSRDAEALGRPEKTPVLMIERVARDLTGRPIEWRRTRCLTQHHSWSVSLR